jgi:Spy/CpxP family protein refolding chaperone
MIKKLTITSLTALSLLLVTAQAEGTMKCNGGKCGSSMMKQAKQGAKMSKKRKNSPFLIKHGLPHLTKMLMKNWDDAKLALTAEQKEALTKVRQETMGSVKSLKPQIMALTKEIVQASKAGTKAAELKSKVEKLASLEAEATMTHLKCIEDSKAALKPEQIAYLMEKRKAQRQMKKGMKCASGKCGKK